MARTIWLVVVAAFLAGCGGADDAARTGAVDEPSGAVAADAASPEVLSNDANDAPVTGRFELGTHYFRLSPTQPTSSGPDQVEVAEVFWYGCPHCFNFDPYLERWQTRKADYVSFVRIPAVWNPLLQLHARAFYTAEALDKGAEMHAEFFREIHERGNMLDSKDKLAAFFGRFGVDTTAFETAFDSFAVHTKLQRADELSRRYRINSVPTIIVNGKYTTEGSQIADYDELLEVVDTLTTAERSAR